MHKIFFVLINSTTITSEAKAIVVVSDVMSGEVKEEEEEVVYVPRHGME
jgi:hypothetical protein